MYQYHCKFIVRQVNYSLVFALKLTYGGGYTFLFLFLN